MRAGFNYGLLFTFGGLVLLVIGVELLTWHSRRTARTTGADEMEIADRLARAEAAIREAKVELASARAELAAHR